MNKSYVNENNYQYLSEEYDYKYKPKKCNSRKSIVPLLLYLIIKEETSPNGKHFSQQELLDRLEEKEEITMERKAIGRCIAALTDSGTGICSAPKLGVWYDESKVWNTFE